MVVSTIRINSTELFNITLLSSEFTHLYGVLCSLLHEDDSDKFLVELERRMFDIM